MKNRTIKFFSYAAVAGLLTWEAVPPLAAESRNEIIDLRIESPYFSPNQDEIQDKAFFTPVLVSDWDITRWRFEIMNAQGKLVQRLTGPGFSTLVEWDGTDRKGNLLSEGEYQAVLTAFGSGFKIKSSPQSVWIDDSPPLCSMNLSSASSETGPSMFDVTAQDENALERWQFQVLDVTGRTVYVSWSSGTTSALTWDGTDGTSHRPVPKGTYKAIFQVWDKAGNGSEPAYVDFALSLPPQEDVKTVVKKVVPVQTPLGLLIQLPSKDIFYIARGKPQFRRKTYPVLEEVALLVNAYPQAAVRLDGYSNLYKGSAKDRDLSSLMAWDIYSSLVKQGNVQASRLTVRGRGRVAPADRSAVTPPALKSGVEIILLGPGPW